EQGRDDAVAADRCDSHEEEGDILIGGEVDEGGEDGKNGIRGGHELQLPLLLVGGAARGQLTAPVNAEHGAQSVNHGEPAAELACFQAVAADEKCWLPLGDAG